MISTAYFSLFVRRMDIIMAEIIVAGRDLNISEKGAQVYCVVYYDIGGAWDLLF